MLKYIDIIRNSSYRGRPMLAKAGFENYELSSEALHSEFEILSTDDYEGNRVYERSIIFLFVTAVEELFPGVRVNVEHSISQGLYIELGKGAASPAENIMATELDIHLKIKARMQELVRRDLPVNKRIMRSVDAGELFKDLSYLDKAALFQTLPEDMEIAVYELDGLYGSFYGALAPYTGYLDLFDVLKYKAGLVLMYPSLSKPHSVPEFYTQEKLYQIFRETGEWEAIIGAGTVGALNQIIQQGEGKRLISVAEGLQEKKYACIADAIVKRPHTRIVLIAGPSSSGKTTSSRRLAVQLMVNGISPYPIEMDNYFVNRKDTPRLADGSYDYESLGAIDLHAFNQDIQSLLNGEAVTLPKFDFKTGRREAGDRTITIPKAGVMIIEGIHALNPALLDSIAEKYKFKVYVSALTQLNLDLHNRISTSDVRKIRRMVRDHRTRGYSPDETLTMFKTVTKGEKIYIFPYQEEADEMFNTTLVYELPVLKKHALPLLMEIPKDSPNYHEAQRLITMLSFIADMADEPVPANSVLREFIGGSFFD